MSAALPYRPSIDGLRAVAVAAVVLFHAGAPIPGGFAGVDVFFVLSGFLIGGLLWGELRATGRIDLPAFWMRRLRRLAPGFLVVALVSLVVGSVVLLPFELREAGKEAVAATVWLSNVVFWRGSGYFDAGSDSKLFLHTWSLSVEEQFYVALPLLLMALAALRWRAVPVLVALWALSLGACLWLTPSQPSATFFLFPFRAWEMLTGVLLAVLAPRLPPRGAVAAGWAGLALVALSLAVVREAGFPGWQAVLPVAGTALALMGPEGRGAARLLSLRGPVALGRVSYALYLWHWPVLVLMAQWAGELSAAQRAAGVALSLLLAVLSWRLVETPLRRPGALPAPVFLGGVAAAAALVVAGGAALYRAEGWPGRFGPEVRAQIDASQGFLQDWSRCSVPTEGPFAGIEACAIGPEGPPRVLFWGDSHLRALMEGVGEQAALAGTPGLIVWRAGCPPLGALAKRESSATPADDATCPETGAAVLRAIGAAEGLERVVLVGRWAYYAEGRGVGVDAANTIRLIGPGDPDPASALPAPGQAGLLADALAGAARAIEAMGPAVAILRQVPEMPLYGSRAAARDLAHGRLDAAGLAARATADPAVIAARRSLGESALDGLATGGTIDILDPWPILCDPVCGAMRGSRSMYFDNNHLTNDGARLVAPLLAPLLRDAAP